MGLPGLILKKTTKKYTKMFVYTYISEILTPSALGHIFTTSLGYGTMVLLTFGKAYGGSKINGVSVYYFKPL